MSWIKNIYSEFAEEFGFVPKTDADLFKLLNIMLLEHVNYTFYAGGVLTEREQILRGCLMLKHKSSFRKMLKEWFDVDR